MEGEGERAGAKEEVEAEARVRKHVMKTRRIKRSMMIAMTTQQPKAKAKAKTAKTKSAATAKQTRKPNKSKSEDEPAKKSSKAARKKHPRAEASRDEGGDAADDCPETVKKSKATEVPVSESPKEIPTKRKPRGKKTNAAEPPNTGEKPSSSTDKPKIPKRKAKDLTEKTKAEKKKEEPKDPTSTKQRLSRKSAAYHRAKKAALKEGKTEEEANALAKAVFQLKAGTFLFVILGLGFVIYWGALQSQHMVGSKWVI